MSTSSASSHDMYPVSPIRKTKSTSSEAELIKSIQANVGGPAGLSVLENPADVRKAVIHALARVQENACDAERIKLGDLNPKERRIVRTVTNRGAAVRSRLRQRKELERLREQLKEKDTRVKMLEHVLTQAIAGGKYIPPAVHQLLPNLILPGTALPIATGNGMVKQGNQYTTANNAGIPMKQPSLYSTASLENDTLWYQEETKPKNNYNNNIYSSPIPQRQQQQYNININHQQVPYDQLPLTYAAGSPISTISHVSLKQEDEITSENSSSVEGNIHALEQLISHNNSTTQQQYQYQYNNLFV